MWLYTSYIKFIKSLTYSQAADASWRFKLNPNIWNSDSKDLKNWISVAFPNMAQPYYSTLSNF